MDAAAGRCEALLDRGGRGVDMMSDVAKAPASSRRAVRRMCTAPPFVVGHAASKLKPIVIINVKHLTLRSTPSKRPAAHTAASGPSPATRPPLSCE